MARLKKDLPPENKSKSIKIVTGKVTKAKTNTVLPEVSHQKKKLGRPPNVPRKPGQQTTETVISLLRTPFAMNSRLENTSTPFNKVYEATPMRSNVLQKDSVLPSALRTPLSPILGDITGFNCRNSRTIDKSPSRLQKKSIVSAKNTNNTNESVEVSTIPTKRIGGRRKSIGVRKMVASDKNLPMPSHDKTKDHTLIRNLHADWSSTIQEDSLTTILDDSPIKQTKYRNNNCSSLRMACNSTISNMLPKSEQLTNGRRMEENTLVRGILNDWPSMSVAEVSTQNQNLYRKKITKRRLTTLAEVSVDEWVSPEKEPIETATRGFDDDDEDDYSSSAEFENDDVCRSKRAPTWKDITNKSNEFPSFKMKSCSPKLRRLNVKHFDSSQNSRSCTARKELFSENQSILKDVCTELPEDDLPSRENTVTMKTQGVITSIKQKEATLNKKQALLKVKVCRMREIERMSPKKTKVSQHSDANIASSQNTKTNNVNSMIKQGTCESIAKGCETQENLHATIQQNLEKVFENVSIDLPEVLPAKENGEDQKHVQTDKQSQAKKRKVLPKVKLRNTKTNNVNSMMKQGNCESIAESCETQENLQAKVQQNLEKVFENVSIDLTEVLPAKDNGEYQKDVQTDKQSKPKKRNISPKVKLRRMHRITKARKSRPMSETHEIVNEKTNNKNNDVPLTTAVQDHKNTSTELLITLQQDFEEAFKNESFHLPDVQAPKAEQVKSSNDIPKSIIDDLASETNNLHEKSKSNDDSINSSRHDNLENISEIDLTISKYPQKFFHSRCEKISPSQSNKKVTKRKRKSTKQKTESVYEFCSQSSSDSIKPVDDVIEKLIKTGRARVAKHKKGSGRPVIKRKAKAAAKQKKVTKNAEPVSKPKPLPKPQPLQELPPKRLPKPQPLQELPIEVDDDFSFDDGGEMVPEEEPIRDQRGFSDLARSAMIKEAGRTYKTPQRKSIKDRKKLLSMALKIVNQSTPIRVTSEPKKPPQNLTPAGNKSPWRVDDDNLPSIFYLGRNSANLPSFSSDYIPMTPVKNKSKSLSSFSSNDSNMENIAPPCSKAFANENGIQPLLSPRRALSTRSPLKAINIIEVVNLPPLALHNYGKKTSEENIARNISRKSPQRVVSNQTASDFLASIHDENRDEVENCISILSPSKSKQNSAKSRGDQSNENATNMFGFDEFIGGEDDLSNVNIDETILPNKENLKEKLKQLQKLRPETPVLKASTNNNIRPVFDNVIPKQRTLKQMLCSTMIENSPRGHLANKDAREDNFNEMGDLSNLFKDPEPETTFDESHPRRTYNRPFKRKRKLRNNFVMFLDSDVSDEEEEEKEKNHKANQNKRQKKPQKKDPELKKFVNEFNEMCKEVSQYELIVE